jgi:acyl carrier protein phosphodiesterase
MNLLAHAFLSGTQPEVLVGNFLGDFVKGTHWEQYSATIQKGIQLHRFIDDFTDHHAIVKYTIQILRNYCGRYAPVASDLLYDYFLAKNWNNYHHLPLSIFTQEVYATLLLYKTNMPPKAVLLLEAMSQQDWLLHYGSLEGIRKALQGLQRRTQFESHLENAMQALEKHSTELRNDFELFFPQLQKECKMFLEK